MATLIHIAVGVFLVMVRVFTRFALLLFTSIVGVLILVGALVLGLSLLFGGAGFGLFRRRR